MASETTVFVEQSIVDFGFLLADHTCYWKPVIEIVVVYYMTGSRVKYELIQGVYY